MITGGGKNATQSRHDNSPHGHECAATCTAKLVHIRQHNMYNKVRNKSFEERFGRRVKVE